MRTRNLWLVHLATLLELLAMALLVAGCPRAPVNPPPDADAAAAVDAGGPVVDLGCLGWCARAAVLGCPAAQPTPGGAMCAEVCSNNQDGPTPFDTACRARAASCDEADECETRKGVSHPAKTSASSQDRQAASASCSSWCARAKALNCAAAEPTPEGASCIDVCTNANRGPPKWDLACRASAKSCAAADACERKKGK